MIAPAAAFLTYLWHYMLARLVYDELVRPLVHGRVPTALVVAVVAVAGVALSRVAGRRR
ncbi:MAG TPA: hypothetical protein VMA77_33495 [Solirubrobacteraceae bacterium]|nr:hypothetical protein [Solirubrobacteraceae bacterium]